jgi:molybdenum cofactor cytidylyltransferase
VAEAAGIVLAAGAGRRFGGPKLALPFGGSTVIGSVVSALRGAGVAPIVVVIAPHSAEVEAALAGLDTVIAVNEDPDRGMVSSIQAGLRALPESAPRFLVALGDQPRLRSEDIGRLLSVQRESGKSIALPTHGGKRGHPVLFEGRYRAEILALGDEGTLRDVVHAHSDDLVEVELPSDAVIRDIDTQEDYRDELRRAGE